MTTKDTKAPFSAYVFVCIRGLLCSLCSLTSGGFVTRATIAILTMLMAGGAGAQQTLCPGDCAVDGEVQVTDVVIMINVINGSRPIDDCRAGDFDDDARIRANDVTRAVRSILDGCSPGAIGQAAFYRALNGVPDTAEAQAAEEARAAANLTAAVAADVNDGWSWFLLGMYHLLQVGRELTDYDHPAPGVVDEARLAREALDQAVPLLAYDNRIPGFRGAATYNLGVLSDDAALVQLGLDQLDDAIEQNLLFNSFSYLGTVAAVTRPGDPLFTRAIEYLDAGIQSGCTPVTDPRNCGNGGRASHNLQGSFGLFADLYVKAGRLDEARTIYNLALNLPGIEDYRFRDLLTARLASVDERAALWADADPTNDPKLIGTGSAACAYCHFR